MIKKTMKIVLIIVSLTILLLLSFSGCISNNKTNNIANVELEGFSHHEIFELPTNFFSSLSFTLQNKGDEIAKNVKLNVDIKDNSGNEVYNKDMNLNYTFDPEEEIVQSIDVFYNIDNTQLEANISISWDGGINEYTIFFEPQFKDYSDVALESLTHHESYNSSNGYIASVDLLIQNRGNIIADNVIIHVIVDDNEGNEIYNKEENLIPSISPWEVKTNEIIIPYDYIDTHLDLSITISWDGGVNHYTRSFEPEYKEYADVKLDNMTHYEHHKIFFGYASIISFIFQNKGDAIAENINLNIDIKDNNGNELYNTDSILTSSLLPGEIKPHDITVKYDFDVTHINLSITISWDGGSNKYSESYEPRIFF